MKITSLTFTFLVFTHGSYNTFSGYPPEIVKKMPKRDLAEEVMEIPMLLPPLFCLSSSKAYTYSRQPQVWRLQAALGEQTEITKYSQQEYERLQNVKFSTLLDTYILNTSGGQLPFLVIFYKNLLNYALLLETA